MRKLECEYCNLKSGSSPSVIVMSDSRIVRMQKQRSCKLFIWKDKLDMEAVSNRDLAESASSKCGCAGMMMGLSSKKISR